MIRFSRDKVLLLHQLLIAETGGAADVRDFGLLYGGAHGRDHAAAPCIDARRQAAHGIEPGGRSRLAGMAADTALLSRPASEEVSPVKPYSSCLRRRPPPRCCRWGPCAWKATGCPAHC